MSYHSCPLVCLRRGKRKPPIQRLDDRALSAGPVPGKVSECNSIRAQLLYVLEPKLGKQVALFFPKGQQDISSYGCTHVLPTGAMRSAQKRDQRFIGRAGAEDWTL